MSQASKPSKLLSHLYLGGKAEAKSKEVLNDLNIKYILNCTPSRNVDRDAGITSFNAITNTSSQNYFYYSFDVGCPNFFEKERSFVYKRIPVFDNRGEDMIAHFDAAHR